MTISKKLGFSVAFLATNDIPSPAKDLLKAATENSISGLDMDTLWAIKFDSTLFNSFAVTEDENGNFRFSPELLPMLLSAAPAARQHLKAANVDLISWEADLSGAATVLRVCYRIKVEEGVYTEPINLSVGPHYAAELAELRNEERYGGLIEDFYEDVEAAANLDEEAITDILTECLIEHRTYKGSLIHIE